MGWNIFKKKAKNEVIEEVIPEHDPTIFVSLARDENGIILPDQPKHGNNGQTSDDGRLSDERREIDERRTATTDRRMIFKRFFFRNFWPFNRRKCIERRTLEPDRRYGVDRRMYDALNRGVEEERTQIIYSKQSSHEAAEQQAANPAQRPLETNFIKPTAENPDSTAIFDDAGTKLAETYRKSLSSGSDGSNYIVILNNDDKDALIYFDGDDGFIKYDDGNKYELNLTTSPSEEITFTIKNNTIIEIDNLLKRNISLVSAQSDVNEVAPLNSLTKKYYTVSLLIKNIGNKIKQLSEHKIKLGSAYISFDHRQIIDIIDESENEIRITGIAGANNLKNYIEGLPANEDIAEEGNTSDISTEENHVTDEEPAEQEHIAAVAQPTLPQENLTTNNEPPQPIQPTTLEPKVESETSVISMPTPQPVISDAPSSQQTVQPSPVQLQGTTPAPENNNLQESPTYNSPAAKRKEPTENNILQKPEIPESSQ